MQPQSGLEPESDDAPSKDVGAITLPIKLPIDSVKKKFSPFLWGGMAIAGVVAYLGLRHYIDKSAKSDDKRVEKLLEERDKAEAERLRLKYELDEANSKLAVEEQRALRLQQEAEALEEEARIADFAIQEANIRITAFEKKLETQVVNVIAEPGVIVEVDLDAVNTQYNCFIDAANAGEDATSCYGE